MKAVAVAVPVAALLLVQAACAQTPAFAHASQKALLKNWALSRCLGQVYDDAKVRADANATASAYLEFGRQPAAAYQALAALVDEAVQRKLSGSLSSDFNTMKCIELYDSPQLDTLAARWASKK